MRKAPIPLMLCAVLAVAPLAGCHKVKARAELKEGNQLYKEEKYKEALEQFKLGVQLDPTLTFAQRSVGLTAMALFKPGDKSRQNMQYADLAVDAFQKYLRDYPQDAKVEDYLVGMWVSSEQYDKAVTYLKKQRQEHPENAKYTQGIVGVLIKAMRFQDAFNFVADKAPRDAGLWYNVGTQAWSKSYNDPTVSFDDRVKVVDLGLQAMQRAVDSKPDYMEAMVYYNLLYREKAKLTLDEKVKAELIAKANEWRDKALALKNKGKQPTPKPSAAR